MNELIRELQQIFDQHRLWVEEIWEDQPRVIKYEIRGDWKHDHLYSDCLVRDYLTARNIPFYKMERVTEEDGSDWYRSIHIYLLLGGDA